ncbi:GCG_CRPN prefix-to-repeats domain-containing protein [Methylobacterium komagatae]|uniref:GCG_CRPN prefix-to-repeats domain-containing protein n=1 Tax=Methylobacterium komagatae TaxID=374425 RepID=A0ABW2BM35_9HYPH
MTKSFLGLAAALALGCLGAVSSAQAAPLAAGSATTLAGGAQVETVAMGCGPGWARGPYGRCRPMYRPRPFYGRRCFIRPTPYGPRRVCRY